MRIEYEATLDDLADEHYRVAVSSKLAKRTRWQSTFWTALCSGLILFMYLTIREANMGERLIFTFFGVLAGAAGYWLTYRRSMKRRILKYLRERIQPEGPCHFVVELRDNCLWTRLGGTQISFDWENVANVVDAGDGVEFHMRDGGFMIVRNKGFLTPGSRNEFINASKQHLNTVARQSIISHD